MKRLVVLSHVVHYRHDGKLYAFGPYAREIDIWADLFPEVVIAAPCRDSAPKGDSMPFERANITIHPILKTGGDSLGAKIAQLIWLPLVIVGLSRAMAHADAIHVRCPGNLGFLGVLLARFFSRYRVAKYAGQWNGYPGENLTGRLQRWLLKSWWWGAPVTVYGEWKNQPPHVHAFFTSMMSDQQVETAVTHAREKTFSYPLRVLFSGRLVAEKRVHVFIDAIAAVAASGIKIEVRIVGDGPLREELEAQARASGIAEFTRFVGAVPFDQSLQHYRWADCLLLPSVHSEGWPKVIAEAMCHGLICVAVDHGQVGRMLNGRGILLPSGETEQFVTALKSIADDPAKFRELGQQASHWSQRYSRDGLRSALAELLQQTWSVRLIQPGNTSTAPEVHSAEILLNE